MGAGRRPSNNVLRRRCDTSKSTPDAALISGIIDNSVVVCDGAGDSVLQATRRSKARRAAANANSASAVLSKAIPHGSITITSDSVAANAGGKKPSSLKLKVQEQEVLAAVASLYADKLKPFGRILRKRVGELAAGLGPGKITSTMRGILPDVDAKHLREVCESCATLRVEAESGGDWSAVLVGQTGSFVDVYSVSDPFPAELWRGAEAYFENLCDDDMTLPGGRYDCAQELISRGLPFLAGLSLGHVCQFVQLAISQKKILGYLNGLAVPYARSQSMVKDQCALSQQPCAADTSSEDGALGAPRCADFAEARRGLQRLLEDCNVPLSNVKRLFRMHFDTELSETALGFSRLSELLQDPYFSDVCELQLQDQGYVLVRRDVPPMAPLDTVLNVPAIPHEQVPVELIADENSPWPGVSVPFSGDFYGSVGFIVRNTFLDAQPALPTPVPGRRRRAQSLPREPGSEQEESLAELLRHLPSLDDAAAQELPARQGEEQLERVVFCPDEPLCLDAAGFALEPLCTPTPTPLLEQARCTRWPQLSPSVMSKNGAVGSIVRNTFIHCATAPRTPCACGSRRRASSLPKDSGSEKSAWEASVHALSFMPRMEKQRDDLDQVLGDALCSPVLRDDAFSKPPNARRMSGVVRTPSPSPLYRYADMLQDRPSQRQCPSHWQSVPYGCVLKIADLL